MISVETLQRHPIFRGVSGLAPLIPHFESLNVERKAVLDTDKYIYFPLTARLGVHELVQDARRMEITSVYPGEATTIIQHLASYGVRATTRVVQDGLVFRTLISQLATMAMFPNLMYNIGEVNRAAMSRVLKTLTCSLEHSLEKRVARYLLTQYNSSISISQQDVADSLGCRREGVTEVFKWLVKEEAIHHSRDHVTVNYDAKLISLSCGCEGHIFPWRARND